MAGMANLQLASRTRWVGKEAIFWGPFTYILTKMGGIPINRKKANNRVDQIAAFIASEKPGIMLGIAPEGTRKWTPHIKSGFYHIATRTNLPILPVSLDFETKTITVGKLYSLTGDKSRDLSELYSFFRVASGKYPEKTAPFKFQD